MKKIWFYFLLGFLMLGFFGCWTKKPPQIDVQGTWEMLSEAFLLSWETVSLSWNEASSSAAIQPSSGTQLSWVQNKVITTLFPVELCNKIISFNRCIISKAPIENQAIMKQQLLKVIEPWKLLVDLQLQEVCYTITQQERFQEVVAHYAEQGCVL